MEATSLDLLIYQIGDMYTAGNFFFPDKACHVSRERSGPTLRSILRFDVVDNERIRAIPAMACPEEPRSKGKEEDRRPDRTRIIHVLSSHRNRLWKRKPDPHVYGEQQSKAVDVNTIKTKVPFSQLESFTSMCRCIACEEHGRDGDGV